MKRIFFILLIGYTLVSMQGCQKSDINLTSQSQYSFDTYFNNSTAINQATVATHERCCITAFGHVNIILSSTCSAMKQKRQLICRAILPSSLITILVLISLHSEAFWGSLYRLIFQRQCGIEQDYRLESNRSHRSGKCETKRCRSTVFACLRLFTSF